MAYLTYASGLGGFTNGTIRKTRGASNCRSGEYLKESAGGSVLAYVTSGGIFQNGASAAVSRALGELGELGRLEPLKMVCFEFVLRRHRIEEQFVAGADIKAAANCTVEDFAH